VGDVGFCSIAPSGRLALFEEQGRLLLFDSITGVRRDITGPRFAVPRAIRWDEQKHVATIQFYDDAPERRIVLTER
jgi:hypothetical protein